jgi:hypothetical protein
VCRLLSVIVLIGILFCLVVCSAGLGALHLLRLSQGTVGIGLLPAAGLALLVVLTTWTALLGLPVWVSSLLLAAAALSGVITAWRTFARKDARLEWLSIDRDARFALGVLMAALVVPALILGRAFADFEVPISNFDGPHHVELMHELRTGAGWDSWYPPGFHAVVAALLNLLPWIDSAAGAFGVSLGLTLLGQLGVFGLGCAIWRKPLVAAAGSLLVGCTYWYPYALHLFSLWPMAAGLVLVLGLWTLAVEYLVRPGIRWVVLAGLLAGGIALAHTVEVYTASIGLVIILCARWRRVSWTRLLLHTSGALVVGVALLAPYLPTLLRWAHGGGVVEAGLALSGSPTSRMGLQGDMLTLLLDNLSGLAIDAPVRLLLLLAGVWWSIRQRRGRLLIPLCLAFASLTVTFAYLEVPVVEWVFTRTFPWSHGYRQVMVAAMLASMVGGGGLSWLLMKPGVVSRVSRLVGIPLLLGYVTFVPVRLEVAATALRTYSADDARAMDWLRTNATPGELVANIGAADAGIWAPYKAGLPILDPHVLPVNQPQQRDLVEANLSRLELVPEAWAAACDLGVRYVYHGAVSPSEIGVPRARSLAELQQSSGVRQVFSSGQAAVFVLRCTP